MLKEGQQEESNIKEKPRRLQINAENSPFQAMFSALEVSWKYGPML